MPDLSEHKYQVKHNERFLESFYKPNTIFLDWAVTVLFYQAVHLVEAFLATKNLHSGNHAERNRNVASYLSPVAKNYRIMYWESRRVRYNIEHPSQKRFDQLTRDHFQPLQTYLSNRIS